MSECFNLGRSCGHLLAFILNSSTISLVRIKHVDKQGLDVGKVIFIKSQHSKAIFFFVSTSIKATATNNQAEFIELKRYT